MVRIDRFDTYDKENDKMNGNRRKALEELKQKIADLRELLDTHKNDLESLRYEEQEYLDCMPENLQLSEKYSTAEAAVDALDEAVNDLEEVDTSLENAIDHIDNAING